MKTLLICTVGGGHQPIIKAIEESQPDFVSFICTGPDPETEQAGSEKQITGKGLVIKERSGNCVCIKKLRRRIFLKIKSPMAFR